MELKTILLGISFLINIISIGLFVNYRRHISEIWHQLKFIIREKTNLRLSDVATYKELQYLQTEINLLLDKNRKHMLEAEQKQTAFLETITHLSHDIRTPLTSLDGYFQLLLAAETEAERAEYSKIISDRIDSLRKILEALFTYARLQDPTYQMEFESFDLTSLVRNTLFSFYEQIKEQADDPLIDLPENQILITNNAEAIQRILQNVINNALVHGVKITKVSLQTTKHKNQESDVRKEQQIAAQFVCENEINASDDLDIEQVFERFYQADASRSSHTTGLGLTIANSLGKAIGADLNVTLQDNIFRFELVLPIN